MQYLHYSFGIAGLGVVSYVLYKYSRKRLNKYVMDKVMDELDRRMDNEEGFTPIRHSTSAILKVTHGGKSHSIYVPYDRKLAAKMRKTRVFLLKDEEKIEITHKPGIPYLISPKDMSGDMIIVENKEGEVLHVFKDSEIPKW